MPIKEKSSFRRRDYEYESPDGDKYSITYIESGDREYVEICRQNEDGSETGEPVRYDYKMFRDITSLLEQSKAPCSHGPSGTRSNKSGLAPPQVTDHRNGSPANAIEQSVNQTMQRYDDNARPVEALQGERKAWQQHARGVDEDIATQPANDTPEEISLKGQDPESLAPWQKEAVGRMSNPRHNNSDKKVRPKRVSARDLI